LLSYRHSFHAGNYADVIKHIVLVEILEHMIKKDKAFDYIDTHAGAGLYDLHGSHAVKLNEYRDGIAKLLPEDWPELNHYLSIIKSFNSDQQLNYYPGSPLIASEYLRRQDRGWFYELHPNDGSLLAKNVGKQKRIRIMNQDGFEGLLALVPPVSRRAVVLIDPSYEVKSDYNTVVDTLIEAYSKFKTGTYALWYPVVDRKQIDQLERRLIKSGMSNIEQYELGIAKDQYGTGMSASGMIVINPPWTLKDKMKSVLPKLVATLGQSDGAFCKCVELVPED
jgi:23S rRNA (adenine2030-N6)-methyltransferase